MSRLRCSYLFQSNNTAADSAVEQQTEHLQEPHCGEKTRITSARRDLRHAHISQDADRRHAVKRPPSVPVRPLTHLYNYHLQCEWVAPGNNGRGIITEWLPDSLPDDHRGATASWWTTPVISKTLWATNKDLLMSVYSTLHAYHGRCSISVWPTTIALSKFHTYFRVFSVLTPQYWQNWVY